jgi:hypothetical protein
MAIDVLHSMYIFQYSITDMTFTGLNYMRKTGDKKQEQQAYLS